MPSSSRSGRPDVVRWVVLLVGVVVATAGFVGLVTAENHGHGRSPWWLVGLVGVAAVLLALGSPWKGRSSAD